MTVVEARTVLIVDDNPDTLDICARLLGPAGYRVLRARGVDEALEYLNSANVDLVILDIAMPGRSGFEAVRAIRALPGGGDIPIVGLSGLCAEAEKEALAAGFTVFCRKPVEPRRLLEEVRRLAPLPVQQTVPEVG